MLQALAPFTTFFSIYISPSLFLSSNGAHFEDLTCSVYLLKLHELLALPPPTLCLLSFSLRPNMTNSSTLSTNTPFSCFSRQFKECSVNRVRFRLTLKRKSDPILSAKCAQISDSVLHSSPPRSLNLPKPNLSVSRAGMAYEEAVDEKVKRLVLEFESLEEPIDRVKRLLKYAERLPSFDESARVEANRVTGCTTQVWLEARLGECGRMRFFADSDSEITKGFVSCLIWILDGAAPEEVLMVKAEDLGAMNVGLHGKVQSRVNTWHNVLISIQKRTAALLDERGRVSPS